MQLPSNISIITDGQYCIQCFSGPIERLYKDNLTYYKCLACGSVMERSLVIDSGIVWWLDDERKYWHESVGVIVQNNEKILCLKRQIFPFAYALPSGHLDIGELPAQAARRELAEETNLLYDGIFAHLADFDIPGDSCRRGSDHHRWHLFHLQIKESVTVQLSDEAASATWFSLPELRQRSDIVFPLRFIIEKFGDAILMPN